MLVSAPCQRQISVLAANWQAFAQTINFTKSLSVSRERAALVTN